MTWRLRRGRKLRAPGMGSAGSSANPFRPIRTSSFGKRESWSGLGGGLIGDIRDGLLVDELIGVGQGNVIGGAFSHPVALAYRIEKGAITGRVKDAAVAGKVYGLLKRVGGFGNDGRWLGTRFAPSLLLEGVS